MKKITIVDTSVVRAIYIGNELFTQDEAHLINSDLIVELLNTLEIAYETEVVSDIDSRIEAYLDEYGELPETLREVHQIVAGD